MMNYKLIKVLMVVLFAITNVIVSYGQNNILPYGFAGPTKTYVLTANRENYYYLQLGSEQEQAGTDDEVLYLWEIWSVSDDASAVFVSGDGGAEDEWQQIEPRPWVRLSSTLPHSYGEFIFRCTRASKYGNQDEYTTVELVDEVRIASVIPIPGQNCWNDGDEITMDQFIVKTEPEGYEEHVALAENSRVAHAWTGGAHNQPLDFLIMDEPSDFHIDICVIESSWEAGVNVGIDKKSLDAIKVLEESSKLVEKINKINQKIENAKFVKATGVKFDLNPRGTMSYAYKQLCCEGEKVGYHTVSSTIGVDAELSAHKKIHPVLPVYLDFGIGLSLAFSLFEVDISTHQGCSFVNMIPITLDGNVFVGASIDPFDNPDLFSVGVKGIGGATGTFFYYTTNNSWQFPSYDFYFKIEASIICPFANAHWSWNVLD